MPTHSIYLYISLGTARWSRRDRINRLKREQRAFLEGFSTEARGILEALLEKYAEHGIDQLDDFGVLQVPPLASYGTPVEIATRFGGADKLHQAVDRLGDLLYAA